MQSLEPDYVCNSMYKRSCNYNCCVDNGHTMLQTTGFTTPEVKCLECLWLESDWLCSCA